MKKLIKIVLVLTISLSNSAISYAKGNVNTTPGDDGKVGVVGNHEQDIGAENKITSANGYDWSVGNDSYITLPDGKTKAYCINPGYAAVKDNARCVPKVLDDKTDSGKYKDFVQSAKYVFTNGGNDRYTVGNALKVSATATGASRAKEDNNVSCAYIAAAKTATKGTKYKYSSKETSNSGSTKCTDVPMSGKGIDLASQALNSAATSNKTSKVGTVKYKLKEGKERITIEVTNNTSVEAKLSTTCSSYAEGCGVLTIAPGKTAKQVITSTSEDCENNLPYFTGDISYNPKTDGDKEATPSSGEGTPEKECDQVTLYNCGGENQQYVACTHWNTKKTESEKPEGEEPTEGEKGEEVIPLEGGAEIEVPCEEPEGEEELECPYKETDYVQELPGEKLADRDAAAMCDMAESKELIQQASMIKDNSVLIEACAYNDDRNFIGKSGYCEWYCTEDYTFNTGPNPSTIAPVALDIKQDNLTAGTFFNFMQKEIYDRTDIVCYSKNDLNALVHEIERDMSYPSTYNDKTIKEYNCHPYDSCQTCTRQVTTTDSEGNPHTSIQSYSCNCRAMHRETVDTTYWIGHVDNNYGYTWEEKHTGFVDSGDSGSGYACAHATGTTIESGTINFGGLSTEVNDKVTAFNACTASGGQASNLPTLLNLDGNCKRTLMYNYYDGKALNITPLNLRSSTSGTTNADNIQNWSCLKDGSSYVTGSRADCEDPAKSKTITIMDINNSTKKISVNLPSAATHTTAEVHATNKYYIEGIIINNDYSAQKRCFSAPAGYDTSGLGGYLNDCNPTTQKVGWPISYQTPQGLYRYSFDIKDINSCVNNKQTFGLDSSNNYYDIDCVYEVNGCENCEHWCDDTTGDCGPGECEECMYDCVGAGCLYDEAGGLAPQYKPISLININEAFVYMDMNQGGVAQLLSTKKDLDNKVSTLKATKLAGNPSDEVDLSKSKNWGTTKGRTTIDEMIDPSKKNGEDIYAHEPQYRIVLTPAIIKDIQDDNATNGYLGNLVCENQGGDYVTCLSPYIHNLGIEEHFEGNQKFTPWEGTPSFDDSIGPAWK